MCCVVTNYHTQLTAEARKDETFRPKITAAPTSGQLDKQGDKFDELYKKATESRLRREERLKVRKFEIELRAGYRA